MRLCRAACAGALTMMLAGLAACATPAADSKEQQPAPTITAAQPVRDGTEPAAAAPAQAAIAAEQPTLPSLPAAPPIAVPAPPPIVIVQEAPAAAAPALTEEEQQTFTLLADLQRYASASPEELRREIAAINQAGNPRSRTDVNRIRLAVLLTMPAAGAPDDARALGLLESVSGRNGGTSPVKQLALVLYAQVAERMRNVNDEKKRSALAQEKLDQLRAVERSLLLERSRNAGGAGGGGGGGGTGR